MKRLCIAVALLLGCCMVAAPVYAEETATAGGDTQYETQLKAQIEMNKEFIVAYGKTAEDYEASRLSGDPVTRIASVEELQAFVRSINEEKISYKGVTVSLEADLDLTGVDWEPIEYFNGQFNGNAHTLSGLMIDADENSVFSGLFGVLGKEAQVTDLMIQGGNISGYRNVGSLAGANFGTISACQYDGTIWSNDLYAQSAYGSASGGITGINFGTVANCETSGSFTREGLYLGGIAGINLGDYTSGLSEQKGVHTCVNNAALTNMVQEDHESAGAAGGIVGCNMPEFNRTDAEAMPDQVTGCVNNGNITTDCNCVGGIIGMLIDGRVSNCTNYGTISPGGLWNGGIVGTFNQYTYYGAHNDDKQLLYVKNCSNHGAISGKTRVGGIVGGEMCYSSMSRSQSCQGVIACYNTGTVTGTGLAGGIDGYAYGLISRCFNTGDVYGSNPGPGSGYIGGIAGVNTSKGVEDCFNTGNLYLQTDVLEDTCGVGGITGSSPSPSPITRCYSVGAVDGSQAADTVDDNQYTVYYGGICASGNNKAISQCYFNQDTAAKAKRSIGILLDQDDKGPLRTWQMTGQPAAVFMTGLMEGGAFETMDHQTIDTLNYGFTPKLKTLPAAYEAAGLEGSGAYPYAVVTLPEGEGYTVVTADGYHADFVSLGSDFRFSVVRAEGYADYTFEVRTESGVLTPDADGFYTISPVEANQTVSVTLTPPSEKGDDDQPEATTPTPPASSASGGGGTQSPGTGLSDHAGSLFIIPLLVAGMLTTGAWIVRGKHRQS